MRAIDSRERIGSNLASARRPRNGARLLAALAGLVLLAGCAGYRIRGLVTEGTTPAVLLVKKDDPRLGRPGLGGAVVEMTIDPHRMTPRPLAPVSSDGEGRFEAGVPEPGAGLLEYDVSIRCRLAGYESVAQEMPLPPSDRRLLIVLVPGRDSSPPAGDILRDTLRLKEQLEK